MADEGGRVSFLLKCMPWGGFQLIPLDVTIPMHVDSFEWTQYVKKESARK